MLSSSCASGSRTTEIHFSFVLLPNAEFRVLHWQKTTPLLYPTYVHIAQFCDPEHFGSTPKLHKTS